MADKSVASGGSDEESALLRRNMRAPLGLLTCLLLQATLVTGLFFAYPSISVILKDDGVYEEWCKEDKTNPVPCTGNACICEAQEERLAVIFTVGSFMMMGARLPVGAFLDKVGPRITSSAGAFCASLGLILFGVGGQDFDTFVAAMFFLTLGGTGVHMSMFHVSTLFPPKQRSLAVGAMSATLTISGLLGLPLLLLYEAGISRLAIFVGYGIIYGVIAFLPLALGLLQPWRAFCESDELVFEPCRLRFRKVAHTAAASVAAAAADTEEERLGTLRTQVQAFKDLPLRKQLLSMECLELSIFIALLYISMTYYLSIVHNQLLLLGDTDSVYTKVFTFASPIGILVVPFSGVMIDKLTHAGTFLTATLAFVLSWFLSCIPVLQLQVCTFIVWAYGRQVMFIAFFAYVGHRFGFKSFGTVVGVVSGASAVATFVSFPLNALIAGPLDGSYLEVTIGFVVLNCVLLLYPIRLLLRQGSIVIPTFRRYHKI